MPRGRVTARGRDADRALVLFCCVAPDHWPQRRASRPDVVRVRAGQDGYCPLGPEARSPHDWVATAGIRLDVMRRVAPTLRQGRQRPSGG